MAVVVAEAAMVLMFSKKKKSDEEEVFFFFVLECRIFGQSGTIAICFVTLAEQFFWARTSQP